MPGGYQEQAFTSKEQIKSEGIGNGQVEIPHLSNGLFQEIQRIASHNHNGVGSSAIDAKQAILPNSDIILRALFNYQTPTENSHKTGLRIQFGWNYQAGDGVSTAFQQAITFPQSYTTILWVAASSLGYKSGSPAPSDITDFGTTGPSSSPFLIQAGIPTTTGFTARIHRGASWNTTDYAGFAWIAIGIL